MKGGTPNEEKNTPNPQRLWKKIGEGNLSGEVGREKKQWPSNL